MNKDLRILVVDDFASIRAITKKTLEGLGYWNFIEAADGKIAWNVLINEKSPIGLIICDWNMPNFNGLEFLKKMKSDSRFKTIPLIMSTTKNEKEAILEAVQNGVDNFIVKPFLPETFAKKIEEVFSKRS